MSFTRCRMRVVIPRDGSRSTRCLFRRILVSCSSAAERFWPPAASRLSAALYLLDMPAIANLYVCRLAPKKSGDARDLNATHCSPYLPCPLDARRIRHLLIDLLIDSVLFISTYARAPKIIEWLHASRSRSGPGTRGGEQLAFFPHALSWQVVPPTGRVLSHALLS